VGINVISNWIITVPDAMETIIVLVLFVLAALSDDKRTRSLFS
jgi:hypothetical protein